MGTSDLKLPTVEELTATAKEGRFDDRLEDYLPDSFYTRPAPATERVTRSEAHRIGAASVASGGGRSSAARSRRK